MTDWYAAQGLVSGELLSLGGKVLVHGNLAELEFLLANIRAVSLGSNLDSALAGRPWMLLKDHPDMSWVRWPLRTEDFWMQGRVETAPIPMRRWR